MQVVEDHASPIGRMNQRRESGRVRKQIWGAIFGGYFGFASILMILLLLLVFGFVTSQALQVFTVSKISPLSFFFNGNWAPDDLTPAYGIFYYIVGSLSLVGLGLLLAVPLGLGAALFISEVAPTWLGNLLRNVAELFLGIPSILFGLLGIAVVVPQVVKVFNAIAGARILANGFGLIPAVIIVAFMVMPTITTISVESLRAVPVALREGSLALGATRWQTITRTILPSALPGVVTSIILGAARILGETIAVFLVLGARPNLPFQHIAHFPYFEPIPTSTLTAVIPNYFGEATPGSPTSNALWMIALTLLGISAILVAISRGFAARSVYK
jgi:phosphate transport system permease protein